MRRVEAEHEGEELQARRREPGSASSSARRTSGGREEDKRRTHNAAQIAERTDESRREPVREGVAVRDERAAREKGGQPRAQLEKVVRSALACSSSSRRRVDAEPKKTCGWMREARAISALMRRSREKEAHKQVPFATSQKMARSEMMPMVTCRSGRSPASQQALL